MDRSFPSENGEEKRETAIRSVLTQSVLGDSRDGLLLYAWIRTFVIVAVVILASETLLVLGLVTPVAIEGSSMAPAMLGPHVDAQCPHCDCQFAIGADQLPPLGHILCPDCRTLFFDTGPYAIVPGERVRVNRMVKPTRWKVAVFRCPHRPTSYCIKRVLGMPGEHVDFRNGNLLIDGAIVRKSPSVQNLMRQIVHCEQPQRLNWKSDSPTWSWQHKAWHHKSGVSTKLYYLPAGGVVTDDLAVNQAATRPTNVVPDLMVTCEVQISRGASAKFVAEFANGSIVSSPPVTPTQANYQGRAEIVWSLFDQQAMLSVDGVEVWQQDEVAPWPGPPQLSVIAHGKVVLNELCVWRDAYYHTRPVDRWPDSGVQLSAEEFFVVGDNVAISEDSRTWPRPGLPADRVIGVPFGEN